MAALQELRDHSGVIFTRRYSGLAESHVRAEASPPVAGVDTRITREAGTSIVSPYATRRGGMAEWFKAPVLKTGERKLRGFESYSLRQTEYWRGGRVAEGSRLLSG